MTVGDILAQSAERFGDAAAIHLHNDGVYRTYTYQELDHQSNRVAHGLLAEGIEKGTPVGILSWNSIEFVETYFATQKIGAIAVPMNPRGTADDIRYLLKDADIESLIVEQSLLDSIEGLSSLVTQSVNNLYVVKSTENPSYERLRADRITIPDVDVNEDDVDGYYYTSGNTGDPKGVIHTHGDRVRECAIVNAELGIRPNDVSVAPMPLFHSGPLVVGFLANIQFGTPVVLSRKFNPEQVLKSIERYDGTILGGVPTQFKQIVEHPAIDDYDTSSLRFWWFSGAPMANSLRKRCLSCFADRYSEVYGTTETGPPITLLAPEQSSDHPSTCGTGLLSHSIHLVEPRESDLDPSATVDRGETGELIVSGPSIMRGYLNKPAKTDTALIDGWYFTGDLAIRDEAGFYHLQGRKDGMIISGGENIYPAEIEDALIEHEDIKDVAVLGVEHEEWGETPKAYVVLANGSSLSADEVIEYCRRSSSLASYKIPREISFVDGIPRNPGGGSVLTAELKKDSSSNP